MGAKKLNSEASGLLDSKQICDKLNISMRTFRRMIEADELPIVWVRGRIKAKPEAIQQWLDRRELKVK